jgi:hypothetical protein
MEIYPQPRSYELARFALIASLAATALTGCSTFRGNTAPTAVSSAAPSPTNSETSASPPAKIITSGQTPAHENTTVSLQRSLNALLTPYGMPALTLDGNAGGQTKRALCAERLFSGHAASQAQPTAAERNRIITHEKLSSMLPGFVISRTCQVMGININHKLSMIIPVSTGAPAGYFRDSPEAHTTTPGNFHIMSGYYGWHNSTLYPSKHTAGNMLNSGFFNGDQAIHGSDEMSHAVTYPESHGCTRYETKYASKIWSLIGGPTNLPNDAYVAQLKPVPVEVL